MPWLFSKLWGTPTSLFALRCVIAVCAVCRNGTKLELRGSKKPTEEVIVDMTAAPWIPGSPETDRLIDRGFQPMFVDLGDLRLAAGMQLWVKRDSRPQDAAAMLLQEKLAAAKHYSPRLQHVIDMLQLTKRQVDVLLDAFVALDHDEDGVVLFNDFCDSIVSVVVAWLAVPFRSH